MIGLSIVPPSPEEMAHQTDLLRWMGEGAAKWLQWAVTRSDPCSSEASNMAATTLNLTAQIGSVALIVLSVYAVFAAANANGRPSQRERLWREDARSLNHTLSRAGNLLSEVRMSLPPDEPLQDFQDFIVTALAFVPYYLLCAGVFWGNVGFMVAGPKLPYCPS